LQQRFPQFSPSRPSNPFFSPHPFPGNTMRTKLQALSPPPPPFLTNRYKQEEQNLPRNPPPSFPPPPIIYSLLPLPANRSSGSQMRRLSPCQNFPFFSHSLSLFILRTMEEETENTRRRVPSSPPPSFWFFRAIDRGVNVTRYKCAAIPSPPPQFPAEGNAAFGDGVYATPPPPPPLPPYALLYF